MCECKELKATIIQLDFEIHHLREELDIFRKWTKLNEHGHPGNCGCLKCKGY